MHFYLKILFKVYSLILNFKNKIENKEKENMISKIKKYLISNYID